MRLEASRSRDIGQVLAAVACYLPDEHAAYIRAMPQDDVETVLEAYVAARRADARVPAELLDRMQRQLATP